MLGQVWEGQVTVSQLCFAKIDWLLNSDAKEFMLPKDKTGDQNVKGLEELRKRVERVTVKEGIFLYSKIAALWEVSDVEKMGVLYKGGKKEHKKLVVER